MKACLFVENTIITNEILTSSLRRLLNKHEDVTRTLVVQINVAGYSLEA